ncbi:YkgJ family cysteine cluster protein [Candidatus Woesearchaeota archaeon]|nr:YkgJ family cysteine cluster protein [Candidatus Woesearchaeota archaeon]
MNLVQLLCYLFVLLLFFYFIYKRQIKSLLLRNKKFACIRCGLCCESFYVELRESDIRRIEKKGYKRKDFVERKGKFLIIKQVNGRCPFLKVEKGYATCTIHDVWPKACECFPLTKVWGIKCMDSKCKSFDKKFLKG